MRIFPHRNTLIGLLIFGFVFYACGTSDETAEDAPVDLSGYEHSNYEITDTLAEDSDLDDLIRPYINRVQEETQRVLTTSEQSIERGQPEGALGNMVADLIRSRASNEMNQRVDIAVMNNGGLRTPLPSGEITVGMIYELMPFENTIVVQKHTGKQVRKMADQIAAAGGEPISGMRMQIAGDRASGVMIGANQIDPDAHYWVATNNWMADGGGPVTVLHDPVERHNLNVLVREAIINYLNAQESISPETDNRIRS